MKLKRLKHTPVLVAGCVLVLICIARLLRFDLEGLERQSFDARMRVAQFFSPTVATNLGFVFMDETTIRAVQSGELGFHFGLQWPRQVYGRLVNELSLQGAKVIAFDVVFGGLRHDHASVDMGDGTFLESDEVFARAMRKASNVILAVTKDLLPPALFATNAVSLGDISTTKDADGVLRRANAFQIYTNWHPHFRQVEADPEYGVDLSRARVEPGKIVLPRPGAEEISITVDENNNFSVADLGTPPPGTPTHAKAFTLERAWHMGVVMAAMQLKLDLSQAEVNLEKGYIKLRGTNEERVIPVDREGFFYIDWALRPNDPRLVKEPMHDLLLRNFWRLNGSNAVPPVNWTNRLVVVGSSAQVGNELTDRGATPLANDTLLVSKHWNVANSIIANQFIYRPSIWIELLLIIALGALTSFLTWKLSAVPATISVVVAALMYCILGFYLFINFRFWLPIVMPIAGAIAVQHICLVVYRVVFEEKERRRIKSVFSKVVAPDVMAALLGAENLAHIRTRREVTVFFADVRGFTELTDSTQELAANYVREKNLTAEQAEACHDEFARETLATVNTYLNCVIESAIEKKGTFDKLIGDCVMFFWGAPLDHPGHALAAVRAAIEAQRAIHRLNQRRAVENLERESENRTRVSAGLSPKPPLATLSLGTGINTGMVTAGIMGQQDRQINFTVFGREVNLASRLEGISGRGRIFISESTYAHLKRDDPTLAATCIEREPTTPKGFTKPVRIFEVPWLPPGESAEQQTAMMEKPKAETAT